MAFVNSMDLCNLSYHAVEPFIHHSLLCLNWHQMWLKSSRETYCAHTLQMLKRRATVGHDFVLNQAIFTVQPCK